MSEIFHKEEPFEVFILKSLEGFIRGRAEEITKRHIDAATKEIDEAVRTEVAKAALSIGKFVTVRNMGPEIIITIADNRKP